MLESCLAALLQGVFSGSLQHTPAHFSHQAFMCSLEWMPSIL